MKVTSVMFWNFGKKTTKNDNFQQFINVWTWSDIYGKWYNPKHIKLEGTERVCQKQEK